MKILKNTLFTLTAIIVLLLLISLVLPNTVKVERSIEVKAQSKQVFKLVNNLKEWNKWSPWHQLDSTAQFDFTAIYEGAGASFSWKSNNPQLGEGSLQIVESYPDTLIKALMRFRESGVANVTFSFIPSNDACKITWAIENNSDQIPMFYRPFSKYFFLMMDQMVGPDFEKGLGNIKKIVEATPLIYVGEFEAEKREFTGFNYIGIRNKLKGAEISQKLGEFYSLLQNELNQQNVKTIAAPFTINYSAFGDVYDMQAAMATEQLLNTKEPMKSSQLAPGKWLVVKYYGNYDKISPIYQKGFEYLAQNNLKPSAAPMEFYLTDPQLEADTSKWLTEVVFPYME